MAKNDYFYGLGRRKASTARIRLMTGKGTITINNKKAIEYFSNNQRDLDKLVQPLVLIGKEKPMILPSSYKAAAYLDRSTRSSSVLARPSAL